MRGQINGSRNVSSDNDDAGISSEGGDDVVGKYTLQHASANNAQDSMLPWTRWVRDRVISCDRCGVEENLAGAASATLYADFYEDHRRCIVDRGARPAHTLTVREDFAMRALQALITAMGTADLEEHNQFIDAGPGLAMRYAESMLEELDLGVGIAEDEFEEVVEAEAGQRAEIVINYFKYSDESLSPGVPAAVPFAWGDDIEDM